MTKTRVGRTVKRETQGPGVFERSIERNVIVSVEYPNLVGFRLKGTRRTYQITAEDGFLYAVHMKNAHDKIEKAKADAALAREGGHA